MDSGFSFLSPDFVKYVETRVRGGKLLVTLFVYLSMVLGILATLVGIIYFGKAALQDLVMPLTVGIGDTLTATVALWPKLHSSPLSRMVWPMAYALAVGTVSGFIVFILLTLKALRQWMQHSRHIHDKTLDIMQGITDQQKEFAHNIGDALNEVGGILKDLLDAHAELNKYVKFLETAMGISTPLLPNDAIPHGPPTGASR